MSVSSGTNTVSVYQSFKRWWRRVRQYRKDLQLTLAKALLDHRQCDDSYDPSNVKRVAVFRWDDKLGDSIMASLFVDAVHKARPDIEITYITGKQGQLLLGGWSAISNLVVCGRRGWKTAWSLRNIKGQFDLVLELSTGMSAYELFALRQLKAKHYLGYGKQAYQLFDLNVPDDAVHFAARYLAAARIVVGRSVEGEFHLPESEDARRIAAEYVSTKPTGKPKALINLYAAGKHRSFTDDDAERFLRWWLEQWPDMELMLLSVPGREKQLDKLVSAIDSTRVGRTPSPASIELTVALAHVADVIFSPDTAVVHMVAALGRPMVAVYRLKGSEFEGWRPVGKNTRVLFNRQTTNKYDRVSASDFSWPMLKQEVDDIIA